MSAVCTDTSYSWTFNSLSQSPCVVGAYLASVCTGSPPSVNDALPPDYHYNGPLVSTATPCKCSTVYYSVISACATCQDRTYLTWSGWNANCSVTYTTFPDPIPGGTRVPHWAFLPIGSDDLWNIASAEAAVSGPESTPTSGPTVLTGLASTSTSGLFTTVTSSGNTGGGAGGGTQSSKSTNVGAIAGGVVGGVVGLALVALLGVFLFRRRNSNRVAPSSLVNTSQYPTPTAFAAEKPNLGYNHTGSTMATSFPVPSVVGSGAPMRLYDPSDPTTFPSAMNAGAANGPDPTLRPSTNATHGGAPGAEYLYGYNGGPEV